MSAILSMDDVDMEGDAPAHGEGEPGDPTDSEGDHSSRYDNQLSKQKLI